MVSISDLYTDLMSLLNQGFYTKNESDNHYINKNIEAYLDTDTGKLYVTLDEQASLTLNNSNVEVGTGDTITLTTTLLDKNNNGIPYVRVEFKKGSTVIGTGVTNNNGVATLSYTVVETDNFMVSASTRYLHSSNLNITISQLNQIKLKVLVNENTCDYTEEQGYLFPKYYYDSIDWGDGTVESFDELNNGEDYHFYNESGIYEITISGDVYFNDLMRKSWIISADFSHTSYITAIDDEDFFYENSNLESVIFPPSLTLMECYFEDCPSLESLYFTSTTPPSLQAEGTEYAGLGGIPQSCVIHIPQGSYSAYTSAENYPDPNTYTYVVNDNYIELNTTNLTTISSKSLLSYGSVSEYIIYWGDGTSGTYSRTSMPSHEYSSSGNYKIIITSDELITRSGKYGRMTEITNVKLPESITRIDTEAFVECSNLTNINIPNSVTEINSSAFSNCPNLTQLELGENITYIDSYAFAYSGLTSINIPSSVTDIGDSFAYNCPNLTRMYFHWENSEDIVEYYYDKDWWGGASSSFKIIIPQGTRSLYVAKNYPSGLLQEV